MNPDRAPKSSRRTLGKKEVALAAGLAAAGAFGLHEYNQPSATASVEDQTPTENNKRVDHARAQGGDHQDDPTKPKQIEVRRTEATPEHTEFLKLMEQSVLNELAKGDNRFTGSSTVNIDGQLVEGQYFKVVYTGEGSIDIGNIYPNEKTGMMEVTIDEDLNRWIEDNTDNAVELIVTKDPKDFSRIAEEVMKIRDLMERQMKGDYISRSTITDELMENELITTPAAREQKRLEDEIEAGEGEE